MTPLSHPLFLQTLFEILECSFGKPISGRMIRRRGDVIHGHLNKIMGPWAKQCTGTPTLTQLNVGFFLI